MKVKERREQLSKLDQDRDIWIGYDYPHDVQEPDFRTFEESDISDYFGDKEGRIKVGDYIHFAE